MKVDMMFMNTRDILRIFRDAHEELRDRLSPEEMEVLRSAFNAPDADEYVLMEEIKAGVSYV